MAKLYFRHGVMNSGKSLFLISQAYNFKTRNVPYLVLKPALDTRSTHIKSRAINEPLPCQTIGKDSNIINIIKSYNTPKLQWILVDESQFLTPEQVDMLTEVVDDMDINIICYGLRTDFQTHLFPGSKRLFEVADTIEEMKSTCSCGGKAAVNARIDADGYLVTAGAQVECGAEDKYITLCRKCYHKRLNEEQIIK